MARIEAQNRAEINVLDFSNEGFEQFIMMVKNKRYHNYFHVMDFTRKMWGTKWNAYDFDELGSDETKIIFQTAWSNPKPVLIELSKKLPNEKIYVTYADEDIGSNCGSYIIKAGKVTEEKIRPKTEISQEEALSWVKFACEVWGLDYEEHLSEEYADEE